MKKTRIVIVGATSAIADECARIWVQNHAIDLTLVGRDVERVEKVAADLRIRAPMSNIHVMEADFLDPKSIKTVVENIVDQGNVDIVLVTHGVLIDQIQCQRDLDSCNHSLSVNGVSPILFAEAFANHFEEINQGRLALIGSVAGDRARKSNYIYGSGKNMLDFFAKGLRQRFAKTDIKVVLIKPGPTDTPMTSESKAKGAKLAKVEMVATDIVKGIEKGKSVVYTPGKWKWIMFVVKMIPRFIFYKINI